MSSYLSSCVSPQSHANIPRQPCHFAESSTKGALTRQSQPETVVFAVDRKGPEAFLLLDNPAFKFPLKLVGVWIVRYSLNGTASSRSKRPSDVITGCLCFRVDHKPRKGMISTMVGFHRRDKLTKGMCHDIAKTGWCVSFKSSFPHNFDPGKTMSLQALGKLKAL